MGTSFEMFLGGKGFNQAVAAARSGARTSMIGRLGDDDFGHRFLASLHKEGIDATHVGIDAQMGTGVGMPLVEDTGDNSIVVVPRAEPPSLTPKHIMEAEDMIAAADVLLLQFELPHAAVHKAARIARRVGTTVVLNPAPAVMSLESFAGLVDYVVPNEAEAAQLTGIAGDGEGMIQAVRALQAETGARGIILTLGERGIAVIEDGHPEFLEGHRVECVDSVGAGDAFCGGLAASLAAGATLLEAARYGNAAGALAVTQAGAEPSMPRRADVTHLLADATPADPLRFVT